MPKPLQPTLFPLDGPTPSKPSTPNPIWDAVCEAFAMKPTTKRECARIGKVVADLKQREATYDEVIRRVEAYRRRWPDVACTPEAIAKHWDLFEGQTSHLNTAEASQAKWLIEAAQDGSLDEEIQ